MTLHRSFFNRDVVQVARDLIGVSLHVNGVGGVIVETEAYSIDDAAAHSFSGQTLRNSSMFGSVASSYVYRSYGLHWCFNIVCTPGCAVLIRALEPQAGLGLMGERRKTQNAHLLCAGPGRLTQALAITSHHDGLDILAPPFELYRSQSPDVVSGTRIGISKAVTLPWRFGKLNSPFLSRKFVS